MSQASVLTLKHWGNNLGVRLPAAVAKAAHLHADQRVRVLVEEGGRVVIEPLDDAPSRQPSCPGCPSGNRSSG